MCKAELWVRGGLVSSKGVAGLGTATIEEDVLLAAEERVELRGTKNNTGVANSMGVHMVVSHAACACGD